MVDLSIVMLVYQRVNHIPGSFSIAIINFQNCLREKLLEVTICDGNQTSFLDVSCRCCLELTNLLKPALTCFVVCRQMMHGFDANLMFSRGSWKFLVERD